MNKWKYEKLSSLCNRIGDGLHGTPEYSEKSDIYFINGNNLKNGKIEINGSTKSVTSEELSKNFIQLDSNSLLLSINGTLGSMAFFNGEKVMLGKSAAYLNFKTDINKFYYYYFQLPAVQEYFHNVATGSTIKNLSLKSIQDFEVPVPEKSEWKGILEILLSLDAKIELNNNINAELEGMAKTLYDYWFVQFDFPDENEKPYKSSGGKMVWSEEVRREIPYAWELKRTEDLVADIKTGLNPREHFKLGGGSNYYITIKNIEYGRISFDSSCDRIGDDAMERIQKRSNLEKGDILFTSIEPVGKTYLLSENPSNWNINESVFNFKPNYNLVSSEYLFMLLSSKGFNELCKNASTGSIHKGIRITPMKAFKLSYPNNKVLIDDFTKIIEPYLKLIDNNQKENQQLSSLRDWLLPMLMNGQVRVGEIEELQTDKAQVELVVDTITETKKTSRPRTEKSEAFLKKVMLGSHLIYNFYHEREFGHVKFVKLLYLCEQVGNMDLMTNYSKAAAGPFDKKTLASIEKYIETNGWFKINKEPYTGSNGKTFERTFYTLTNKSTEYRKYYDSYFETEKAKIEKLLQLLKGANSRKCEIVATTFYAWKELLKNNTRINDNSLVNGFFDFHPQKGKNFNPVDVKAELPWMKSNGVYPKK